MTEQNRFPIFVPIAVLVFVVAHLAYEHFTGGVGSHNLLNRSDLPAISNWWGLLTLPILALILGLRIRNYPPSALFVGIPRALIASFVIALLYGALMATSFWADFESITFAALIGLFICALLFAIYRIEYVLGFVVGMTITFGGVLPLVVAAVIATLSFIARYVINKVAAWIKRRHVVNKTV